MANKVDKETAEQDFLRMCESRDVETDTEDWTDEDVKEFDELRSVLVRAIQKGHLSVDEDGSPTVQFRKPFTVGEKRYECMTFGEPMMSHFAAGDKYMKEQTKRSLAIQAAMCGTSLAACESMGMADGKLAQKVVQLFLA